MTDGINMQSSTFILDLRRSQELQKLHLTSTLIKRTLFFRKKMISLLSFSTPGERKINTIMLFVFLHEKLFLEVRGKI